MNGPTILSDAEAALVCGGAIAWTISIGVTQRSTSAISQTAITTNAGRALATAAGISVLTTAVGAASSNTAAVSQTNVVEALNLRFGPF